MKNKITLLNTISTLILQLITIISGFIIPKIILSYFGSEINGLVSSIDQFLNYITLLEGGVTGVIMASLYKPLTENNKEKINSIVKTTDMFFKKIGYIYIGYSVILSLVYPIIFNSQFSYKYVFMLVLISSIKWFVQYMFAITYKTLLNADKKVYIVSFTNSIIIVLNIILAYISVKIIPSIHILKFIVGSMYLIQPLVYSSYIKRYYGIDKNVKPDNNLLKQRWNGFAVNVAAFIHSNTDITILSIFSDFKTVSVYSIYMLITNGLKQIILSISNGISPTIGHAIAVGNENETNKKIDMYELVIFLSTFILFSVAGLLITPFVMIYTSGINDANYYQPIFGYLLILSEAIYVIKTHHVNIAYNSNHFKQITKACYIEALTNICISLILIHKLGIIGIAIGTLIAMIYRMIYQINYTNKYLIKRPVTIFYKKLLVYSISCILGIIVCKILIPSVKYTISNWIWHGILYTIVFVAIYLVATVIFYKKDLTRLKKYIKK